MKRNGKFRLAAAAAAVLMLLLGMTVCADGTYTTKAGDNLSKIAKAAYGDEKKWKDIYESNKAQIKDPNVIFANQVLTLPGEAAVPEQAADTAAQEQAQATETPEAEESAAETPAQQMAAMVDSSAFLQKVYALMAAQDYAAMLELDGSDEAEAYVSAITGESAVYTPDGSGSGVGAGVYKYDEYGSYYFYYGGYADGVRTGEGAIYMDGGDCSYLFTGTWSGDAPNGVGMAVITYLDGSEVDTVNGTLVNGLWNGRVSHIVDILDGSYCYDLSYTADNGVPVEDRTQEFLDFMAEHGVDVPLDKDEKVFAYDVGYKEDGAPFYAWPLRIPAGETVGAAGFATYYID